ncbi:DUF6458 family protein [Nocardioides sp. W7]|uniref:DUF6458 family protein n=1 Tax=Nocardioides sp. W7 TaxID=2931390 RepID=UPI001FD59100|nr:DUF6458 family protein [Nocardioides sp. W7]
MGYGLGIFLLALGLILAFAVGDSIGSVDLYTAGLILAGVGVLALVLTVASTMGRRRTGTVATTTHPDGSQTVQERRSTHADPGGI